MTNPPSFEPHDRRRRPEVSNARIVGDGKAKKPKRVPVIHDSAAAVPPHSAARPHNSIHQRYDAGQMPPSIPPRQPSRQSQAHAAASQHAEASQPAARRSVHHQQASAQPAAPHSAARKKRRHVGRTIALTVALLLVVIAAWPIYLVWYGNSKLTHMDALSGAANTPGTTYLIVGSDKRTAEQAAEQDVEGQRADTIMLLQVPSSGSPALVSIPRDSWVSIPGYGDAKINAAYSYGGASLLVQTVENLTGMTIDHYVEVSMEGVKELTDAVGGVNLCLDYDVNDQLSGLVWQSGCHDADGTTALAFSRMRYSDPQGDIGRTDRQRQVVSAILDKATTPGILLNPFKQRALVGAVAENLTTDTDTSIIDLAKAGLGMRSVMGSDGLMGIPPITTINYQVGGQSAVELDPDKIGTFFTKMMNGELTTSNFGQIN